MSHILLEHYQVRQITKMIIYQVIKNTSTKSNHLEPQLENISVVMINQKRIHRRRLILIYRQRIRRLMAVPTLLMHHQ